MNTVSEIERCLRDTFLPTELSIRDDSARHAGHAGVRETGGGHYRIRIVSDAFASLSRIERHRRVYAALESLIPTQIHALAIDARSPDDASST